jgi:hypothetical protein
MACRIYCKAGGDCRRICVWEALSRLLFRGPRGDLRAYRAFGRSGNKDRRHLKAALLCGWRAFGHCHCCWLFDIPALQAFKGVTFRVSTETGDYDHAHLTVRTASAAGFGRFAFEDHCWLLDQAGAQHFQSPMTGRMTRKVASADWNALRMQPARRSRGAGHQPCHRAITHTDNPIRKAMPVAMRARIALPITSLSGRP